MLRELRPDIPVLFLDTVHHFPETYAYRDEIARAVGTESGQPARGSASARTVAGRARVPAAAGTKWSRSSRRSRTTTSGSPACGASSRQARAGLTEIEPFRCRRARRCGRSARSRRGRRREVWDYAKRHDIPLLPLYDLRLHQHRLRAVHDPAARSLRRTIGPLAADRSSSAGSTSSRWDAMQSAEMQECGIRNRSRVRMPRSACRHRSALVSAPPTRSAPSRARRRRPQPRSGGGWRSSPTTARRPLRRAA